MTRWIGLLPNIDQGSIDKGCELLRKRAELQRALENNLREEAELFMTLYHSGKYSTEQMSEVAIKGLGWDVVKYLPPRLPNPKKRDNRRG